MTTIKAVPRSGELDRDADGFPEGLRNTGEPRAPVNVSTITGGTVPVNAKVDQSNSGNVNHHLPWLMVSAILGAIGTTLGIVLLCLWLISGPEYLRAIAEARVAKAEANSELARKEASNAMDIVDLDRQTRKAQEAAKK